MFHPDRAEEDDIDLEVVVESESETEARTASPGARRWVKGESDSSIKRFMADWTSDSDASGGHGAESEPPARKAEGKRPRKDAAAAGTSKTSKKKTGTDRSVQLLPLLPLGPPAPCLKPFLCRSIS